MSKTVPYWRTCGCQRHVWVPWMAAWLRLTSNVGRVTHSWWEFADIFEDRVTLAGAPVPKCAGCGMWLYPGGCTTTRGPEQGADDE